MSMFIPPRANHSFNSRGLHLWFSSSSWIGRRVLYLMEDFSREPQDPSCLGSGSAYQILQLIVRELLHSKLLRSNSMSGCEALIPLLGIMDDEGIMPDATRGMLLKHVIPDVLGVRQAVAVKASYQELDLARNSLIRSLSELKVEIGTWR